MQTPSNSRKRRRYNDPHETASVSRGAIRTSRPSKALTKFSNLVHKVIDDPKATGTFIQAVTTILRSTSYNKWTLIYYDAGSAAGANAAQLEFFSPRQIKDAEGILFNGKTASFNSFATVTEAANQNLPAQTRVHVKSMSATFRFKNVSQHKTYVEMFICGGNDGSSPTGIPQDDYQQALESSRVTTVNGVTSNSGNYITQLNMPISNPEAFTRMWNVEKITFEFEPGEEAVHIMKGKPNYMFNGSNKLEASSDVGNPVWLSPTRSGCGKLVFFRIINEATLTTATTGDVDASGYRISVCHPPHITPTDTLAGGVICSIVRKYVIAQPEDHVVGLGKDVLVVNNNYHTPSGTIADIEIDEDQPGTLVANPL